MRFLLILFILLATNSFALECKLEIPKKNYETCYPISKWTQEQREPTKQEKEQIYKDVIGEKSKENK